MAVWALLWVLYLSIVNVGQIWYSFGWESLLLETGFLAIFLGPATVEPPVLTLWLLRWVLFRVEFGAGLIKLRGDPCWRSLTCLYYHHETQPMPTRSAGTSITCPNRCTAWSARAITSCNSRCRSRCSCRNRSRASPRR